MWILRIYLCLRCTLLDHFPLHHFNSCLHSAFPCLTFSCSLICSVVEEIQNGRNSTCLFTSECMGPRRGPGTVGP